MCPSSKSLDDSLIAMAGRDRAVPDSGRSGPRHEFALDWKTAVKLPWGVLLLFGGGLSLAAALTDSGLAAGSASKSSVLQRCRRSGRSC